MNVNTMPKHEYMIFLVKKGVLKWETYKNWWNPATSKKELAFIESGYPFEEGITFEMALDTKATFLGFRNEFGGGVKDPALFEQTKRMADWKHYLSLSQIRHAVWSRPEEGNR